MAGTFNGNPLTMAASKATLTEVLTRDAYDHFNAIHKVLADGCTSVIEKYRLPAYVTGIGAKGSVIYSADAGARVPRRDRDRRAHHVPRLALPAEPRRLQVAVVEAGDLDDLRLPHGRGRRRATWTTSRSSSARSRRRLRRDGRHRVPRSRSTTVVRWTSAWPDLEDGVPLVAHHGTPSSGRPFAPYVEAASRAWAPPGDVLPAGLRGIVTGPRSFGGRAARRYRAGSPTTWAPTASSRPDSPAAGRTRSRVPRSSRIASSRARRPRGSAPGTRTGSTSWRAWPTRTWRR